MALLVSASIVNAQQLTGTNGDIYVQNPPAGHASDGVLMVAKTATPDIGAKLGGTAEAAGFTVFDSADLALFTVTGAGRVGIGTTTPAEAFHLVKNSSAIARMRVANDNTAGGAALWFTDATAVRAEISSYGSTNSSRPNQLVIGNKAGGQMLFQTYDPVAAVTVDALRIMPTGRMSYGNSNPSHRIQIQSTLDGEVPLYGVSNATIETSTTQSDIGVVGYSYQNVQAGAFNSGYANGVRARGALNGVGELNDSYGVLADTGITSLGVNGIVREAHGVFASVFRDAGTINTGYGFRSGPINATTAIGVKVDGNMVATTAYGLKIDNITSSGTTWGIHQGGNDDANLLSGHVQIGPVTEPPATVQKLLVNGSAHFTGTVTGGNIEAKYQDVAEWVPSTTDLLPATVVVLNPAKNNEVMISGTAYDSTVAGVVSAQPGLSLGEAGAGKEQIATTGRVKVRVDASRGAIGIGDLLVTSDLPGTAMKSEPMIISGRRFHQPGTIIGKALEPLAKGTGEILVLLSMQ